MHGLLWEFVLANIWTIKGEVRARLRVRSLKTGILKLIYDLVLTVRLTSVADDPGTLAGTTVVGGDVRTVQNVRLCSLTENIVHTEVCADLAEVRVGGGLTSSKVAQHPADNIGGILVPVIITECNQT